MRVSFDLSPKDLRYFRNRLRHARDRGGDPDEAAVLRRAAQLIKRARRAEPPEFVLERIEKLDRLTLMLVDEEWNLEGRDRERILNALAYFAEPEDLIPDRVPGVGFLDDAIMVELVVQELRHEIESYEDFCALRRNADDRKGAPKRDARRLALQARARRRLQRDRARLKARRGGAKRGLL